MKNMKRLSLTCMAVLAGLLLTASGCNITAGTGSKSVVYQPTVGQQLMDLKKARDAGAITEEEYEARRAKLLK